MSDKLSEFKMQEYFVDTITNKKLVNGKVQYFIKWKNWHEDTWEAEDELLKQYAAADFITAFEKSEIERQGISSQKRKVDDEPENVKKKKEKNLLKGFARGLKPEKVLGATNLDGKLMLLMKWIGTDEVDMMVASEVNVKCPQLVINFYEDRLTIT